MRLKWSFAFIVVVLMATMQSAAFSAEQYTLDPEHTFVSYQVNHLGFSNQVGKWPASGILKLDKNKPQNSKVAVKIIVDDMVTGIDELDKHLKSELFFDVARYPVATFTSHKVEVTSKNTAKVYGALVLHGVSKPVVLAVKLNKAGQNPMSDKLTVGFSASTTIKRSDFGMSTFLPAIGDDVVIDIEAEAYTSNKAEDLDL